MPRTRLMRELPLPTTLRPDGEPDSSKGKGQSDQGQDRATASTGQSNGFPSKCSSPFEVSDLAQQVLEFIIPGLNQHLITR